MTERDPLKKTVERLLGGRVLVWAGLRGEDIGPLSDVAQLEASVSIIGAFGGRTYVEGYAYEQMSGRRTDLEVWDIDNHLDQPASKEFRRTILRLLAQPSALLPYRPSRFLSALHFARRDRCLSLGLFGAHQQAFDHKPWVETSLRAEGVSSVPWTYLADEERKNALKQLDEGPIVLRRSRTSGGEGFYVIESQEDLAESWPQSEEGFVCVAPYLEGAVPVNIGGTVWRDGVTLHRPSIQLIGISSCVTREFGYCGNDFGSVKDLDDVVIGNIEKTSLQIGQWLHRHGYRGTFGVDFLVHDGKPLFTEVNPRFQGSTPASASLSISEGHACLYLEHMAALLGEPAPTHIPLLDQVNSTPKYGHLVVHLLGHHAQRPDTARLVRRLLEVPTVSRVDLIPPPEVEIDPGAVVCRAAINGSLTRTGFDLASPYEELISEWQMNETKRTISAANE